MPPDAERHPPPMMQCGHAANALRLLSDEDAEALRPLDGIEVEFDGPNRIRSCAICSGIHPGACKIQKPPPDLSGRTARCAYFGGAPITPRRYANNECDHCVTGQPCSCERPSSPSLAFFEHQPDREYDKFYCGCRGWD